MADTVIVLGGNFQPPVICMKTTQKVYNCVRTDEFDVAVFNSLLMGVVTYLDAHKVKYGDKALPWAEVALST